jgi:hypothetical protein
MCFFLLIGVLDSGISIMIDGTFLNSNPSALGYDAFNFERCSCSLHNKKGLWNLELTTMTCQLLVLQATPLTARHRILEVKHFR